MAQLPKSRNFQYGFKPILILTVATILLLKTQRVISEDSSSSEAESTSVSSAQICPDFCSLPSDRATRSKAPFRMWYYDVSDQECKRFRWGGRGGNKNRFMKKIDCEETCANKCSLNYIQDDGNSPGTQDAGNQQNMICALPVDEGQCSDTVGQTQLAWYFDTEKETCAPFIYRGCMGNGNRFADQAECEEACN